MSETPPLESADLPLWRRLRAAPLLDDKTAAESRLKGLLATQAGADLQDLADEPCVHALLLALANHSSYLWHIAAADAQRLKRCLEMAPVACLEACLTRLAGACRAASSEAVVMRELRLAKQEVALLVALADLGGVFDVIAATQALSQAADALISAALGFLLRQAAGAGKLQLAEEADPGWGCGLFILALGKLGGRELNYSSDVDLAVFFDPAASAIPQGAEPAALFVRITKGLVRLLQERTADGYVLRVDLRLRPDPGATPIAISLPAAQTLAQRQSRSRCLQPMPITKASARTGSGRP
jgi:glutamate-ammonia-ligase adenylyltransferase